MSAPLSKALFHGTHVEFNPGDIIRPANKVENVQINYGSNPVYKEEAGTHAYATDDIEEAKWFAGESARMNKGEAKVYKVKPLGKTKKRPLYDLENEDLPKEARSVKEYLSRKGFKVVKKVKYVGAGK